MPPFPPLPPWFFETVDVIKLFWQPAATVITLVTVLATYLRARQMWRRRDFMRRINFTLNYIEGTTLKFRTLREDELADILLHNDHAQSVVLRAARRTTLERPFLDFTKDDAWMVLNAVLNELSEQFAFGHLARSMGAGAKSEWYVFGLTCERHRDVRMNKLRVMIIARPLLETIDRHENLAFERPSHHVRLQTLRRMKELYHDPNRSHVLAQVELPACGG